MACPLVAGLCGLMKSYKPSATNILIEGCLKNSAENIDNLNSGFENLMGSGRIDAFRALNCLTGKPSVNFSNTINQGCTSVQINFNDLSVGSNILSYGWTFIGANIKTSNLKNPVAIYSISGVYTVIHSASNEFGTNITTKNIDIEINIVSATLSGTATINSGQQTYLKVDFRGKSPYSFKLNDVN
ncbi:MAG: hypothetical protein EAZ27_13190 [Cytophagales bacterium]|nr:MAG: hypothetical protein EAZ27_13190 [Cytophagales bacterium]